MIYKIITTEIQIGKIYQLDFFNPLIFPARANFKKEILEKLYKAFIRFLRPVKTHRLFMCVKELVIGNLVISFEIFHLDNLEKFVL